jgi:hypothetical protein
MPELFSDQPFLLQWVPSLSHGLVVGINRIGQLLIVISALMAIFQDSLLLSFSQSLRVSATFIRKWAAIVGWRWTKNDVGFEFPPEKPLSDPQFQDDTDIAHQLVFSLIFLVIVAWLSGRGPIGWLSFPFEVAWKGLALWPAVHWNSWEPLMVAAETLGRLLAFVPLLYLSALACFVIARPFAFIFSQTSELVSVGHYRLAVTVVLLLGSFLVVVAT